MAELDSRDHALLAALCQNSRLSEKKLALKTRIPMTTVHNRLKKLCAQGVIKGYSLQLDYSKLGRPLVAYVMVKAAPRADQKKLLAYISARDSVAEAAMITGEFDMIFKARVASMDELNRLVVQDLRTQPAVSETRTFISYETVDGPAKG